MDRVFPCFSFKDKVRFATLVDRWKLEEISCHYELQLARRRNRIRAVPRRVSDIALPVFRRKAASFSSVSGRLCSVYRTVLRRPWTLKCQTKVSILSKSDKAESSIYLHQSLIPWPSTICSKPSCSFGRSSKDVPQFPYPGQFQQRSERSYHQYCMLPFRSKL